MAPGPLPKTGESLNMSNEEAARLSLFCISGLLTENSPDILFVFDVSEEIKPLDKNESNKTAVKAAITGILSRFKALARA